MLKTRVAHGYCSRHLAADACPYANICEHCDNYVPAPEFAPALQDQLADVQTLRNDAEHAAGPPKPPATSTSSNASRPTSAASTATETHRRTSLTPTSMAG
jgi:hypothetical protein